MATQKGFHRGACAEGLNQRKDTGIGAPQGPRPVPTSLFAPRPPPPMTTQSARASGVRGQIPYSLPCSPDTQSGEGPLRNSFTAAGEGTSTARGNIATLLRTPTPQAGHHAHAGAQKLTVPTPCSNPKTYADRNSTSCEWAPTAEKKRQTPTMSA